MILQGDGMLLRPWRGEDIPALVRIADNPRIAASMRDGFPHPYTPADAAHFITQVAADERALILAIEYDGAPVGSIGVHPFDDVYRHTGEIGYWLAEPFWGKGIVPAAVRALLPVAFDRFSLQRLQAGVFSTNTASMRVLEKCGFVREAVHHRAVFKLGQFLDEMLYVRLRDREPGKREG